MGPERFGDAIFWLDCPSVQKPNTRNTKSNGEISRLCQSAACLDKRTLRQIGPMDLWRICRDAPYQDTQQGVAIPANAQSNRGRRAPLQRGEAQHPPRLSASVERIVYVVTANGTCQPVNRCFAQCARARRSDRRSRSRGYPTACRPAHRPSHRIFPAAVEPERGATMHPHFQRADAS
jgi:hypothetical protein